MSEAIHGYHGSSNIADMAYDAEARRLTVSFLNGTAYLFDAVPPEVRMAFDAAQSPGKHFAAHIRGKYPTVKAGQEAS